MSKVPFATSRLTKAILITGLFTLWLCGHVSAAAQTREHDTSDRKIVSRVEPDYPETLKRLYIGGVVKIQVTVDAAGKVESTELLGGSPILGQSAMKAVKQWKYAPAASTGKFVVQLEFDPHR
ncbi:MAG TPA: energy transducer TonB [Verrucomicrobiae bacterium]|nr:energy transducer TonB [Verrucomicrobiae bacterium]